MSRFCLEILILGFHICIDLHAMWWVMGRELTILLYSLGTPVPVKVISRVYLISAGAPVSPHEGGSFRSK